MVLLGLAAADPAAGPAVLSVPADRAEAEAAAVSGLGLDLSDPAAAEAVASAAAEEPVSSAAVSAPAWVAAESFSSERAAPL